MGIFMEAPNIIMKLPKILFWIFGQVELGFKIQSWFEPTLNSKCLFLCLSRIYFCQIITIGLLELPGQIGSSNLFVCQVEQMHLVWRFWEGLASPCYCFQLLLVNISKFKRCHDANMHAKSGKIIRIFQYQTGAVTILPPLQESRPEILGLK